ncbi:MAG: hypothetical protein HKN23_19865 [Verrucomicrobiales bacterium]|nr:hypothetical protein [Verrucomicrobiales bacterium]
MHPALLISGLCTTAIWIALLVISPEFAWEIENDDRPTGRFLAAHFCAFTAMAVAGWFCVKRNSPVPDSRKNLVLLVGFAVLFRAILIPSTPIHESDFYRYQWDGKVAKAGINPFLYEPDALLLWEEEITLPKRDGFLIRKGRKFSDEEIPLLEQLAALRDDNSELFDRVSHKPVTTIYPPMAQAVFWFSSTLFGDSLIGLKIVLALFDLGVIAVTVGLLHMLGISRLGVIFYAWNPLVLKEFSNSAHYDCVPIFFSMLAVFLAVRGAGKAKTALALAAGTLAKYFSVLLVPVLLFDSPKKWLKSVGPIAIFAGAVVVGFLPFWIWNEAGIARVFAGLEAYNRHWEYNPGVFAMIRNLTGDFVLAKKIVAVLLVLVVAIFSLIRKPLAWKAFAVTGALFILSPTAFPWYFAWVLPFLCVFPRVSWLLLGGLLPIHYLDFHTAEAIPFAHAEFWHIRWLSWICWGAFGLAAVFESTGLVRRTYPVGS